MISNARAKKKRQATIPDFLPRATFFFFVHPPGAVQRSATRAHDT